MNGMPKDRKIKKRSIPLPGAYPGWTRMGTQTRAANSSNKAAYKNGSTARAAINIATNIIPKGTNIRPTWEINTTANQKPARRNIVTNKGRSLLSKTNRRPRTKKVSLTVKVNGPTWTSSVIGSFQAIPAKNSITPVPTATVSR